MFRLLTDKKTSWIRQALFAILAAAVFVQCASIAQPQGGPRDSLPPLIISTIPVQRAVNFNGKRITLNFNEYVMLKEQQKEFLMSPPGDKKPMLTVKGRSIEVDFENKPDSNTTYRLDFGNAIADNNEGNKLGGYSYIFSTGPQVDTLMMSGLVQDVRTRDSVVEALIFYFDAKADSAAAYDSVMYKAKPKAVFRTDSSGLFVADILKDMDYRVYAMLDKNGNQKYEAGTDYIAMLDSACNPLRMPDFDMWIEPAKDRKGPRRRVDPPQLRFGLFLEEPVRKQTILKSNRPERQKLELVFNSKDAEIVSFLPVGLDSTWLMRENGVKGDTVWYWIAPPSKKDVEALKDTVKVKITYMTQDSVWKPQLKTEEVAFVHRILDPNARGKRFNTPYADSIRQVKEARVKAKREAKLQKKWLKAARKISRKRGDPPRPDSVLLKDSTLFKQVAVDTTRRDRDREEDPLKAVNPFKFNVAAANPLNPETHIRIAFDYPLRSIDSTRITLIKLTEAKAAPVPGTRRTAVKEESPKSPGKTETPMPFTVEVDSTSMNRRLTIKAAWTVGDEYKLLIPDSVFTDIAFQANDTLQSAFKVADFNKFGTVVLKLSEADSTALPSEYILELQDPEGKPVTRLIHMRPGDNHTVRYLAPGKYRLLVTEDRNGNGIWDTGSLIDRRQPERVRMWEHPVSGRDILAKENWDIEIPIDLKELFSRL